MRKLLLPLLIILAFFSSCRAQPDVDYSAQIDGTWGSLFDVFWNQMNKNYVLFSQDYSGNKWDKVYDDYIDEFRALGKIEETGENKEKALRMLFDISKNLSDGHFEITIRPESGDPLFYYNASIYRHLRDLIDDEDTLFAILTNSYRGESIITALSENTTSIAINTFKLIENWNQNGVISGTILDGKSFDGYRSFEDGLDVLLATIDNDILYLGFSGFLFYPKLLEEGENEAKKLLSKIQMNLNNESIKGIVIDLRGNGGGYNLDLDNLWGMLVEDDLIYAKYRSKDGPNRNDFTPWVDNVLIASADKTIDKPIAVLFNRASSSCAELSLLIFDEIKEIYGVDIKYFGSGNTTGALCTYYAQDVGDDTIPSLNAGAFSSKPYLQIVFTPELERRTVDGKSYEGEGFSPDVLIPFSSEYYAEFEKGNDQLLRASLTWLEKVMN